MRAMPSRRPIPPSFGGVGIFFPETRKSPPGQNQPEWGTHVLEVKNGETNPYTFAARLDRSSIGDTLGMMVSMSVCTLSHC